MQSYKTIVKPIYSELGIILIPLESWRIVSFSLHWVITAIHRQWKQATLGNLTLFYLYTVHIYINMEVIIKSEYWIFFTLSKPQPKPQHTLKKSIEEITLCYICQLILSMFSWDATCVTPFQLLFFVKTFFLWNKL